MYLADLQISAFRNFPDVSLKFPVRGAVIHGANGTGKTNLLEAIHVLCTGRSHRDAMRLEMIRFESEACHLQGVFAEPASGTQRRASIGFGRDRRVSMVLDERPVLALSAWFGCAAALAFGPDDVRLVSGLPRERRRFLDMLICQIDPAYLDNLMRYRSALLNRNKLLTGHIDSTQLDAYDDIMAESGSIVSGRRREIAAFLAAALARIYGEICGEREAGSLRFRPSIEVDSDSGNEWKNVFLRRVKSARSADVRLGFSTTGPHRDDVVFYIDGRPAREFGSRGQCRSLALALRIGSVLCTEHFIHRKMIFLVDDAFSELDHERISRILPLLEDRGQIFLAAPAPTPPNGSLARFVVADNKVVAV